MPPLDLDFAMQPQDQKNWCWSAVAVSVSRFFDRASPWTQCTLANAELGQKTCCANGGSFRCNRPWYLDRALERTRNCDGGPVPPLSQAQIEAELGLGKPIAFRIEWMFGGAHFAAITGLSENGQVRTDDPLYGRSFYPLENLQGRYEGSGSWTDCYRTRRAAP